MGDTGSMFLVLFCFDIHRRLYKGPTFFAILYTDYRHGSAVVEYRFVNLKAHIKREEIFTADKEHVHHKLFWWRAPEKSGLKRFIC